jgi:hypothetical protein
VIDHALTRPWTVTRKYQRDSNSQPVWRADGYLMPAKKDQAPPDLKYF